MTNSGTRIASLKSSRTTGPPAAAVQPARSFENTCKASTSSDAPRTPTRTTSATDSQRKSRDAISLLMRDLPPTTFAGRGDRTPANAKASTVHPARELVTCAARPQDRKNGPNSSQTLANEQQQVVSQN